MLIWQDELAKQAFDLAVQQVQHSQSSEAVGWLQEAA